MSSDDSDRTARFEDLFRGTRTDVLAYLARRAGNPEEAADLLAETYLVAWRRLEAIPPGDQARLWLFGVARNLLKKGARRRRTTDALVRRLAIELGAAQQPGEAIPDGRGDRVLHVLARLENRDREILALTAWEELTPSEIAVVIGVPANLVRVRLHRARAKLRRQLRPDRPASHHRSTVVVDPD